MGSTMLAIPRSDCGEDWTPSDFRRGSAISISTLECKHETQYISQPYHSFPRHIPRLGMHTRHHTLEDRIDVLDRLDRYGTCCIDVLDHINQSLSPATQLHSLLYQAQAGSELAAVDVQARRSPSAAIANASSASCRESLRDRRSVFHLSSYQPTIAPT
jgi:hypothetical protein